MYSRTSRTTWWLLLFYNQLFILSGEVSPSSLIWGYESILGIPLKDQKLRLIPPPHILFGNNYRLKGSCNDSIEKLCVPFANISTLVASYVAMVWCQNQEVDIDKYVYIFITCIDLCNHHYNKDTEIFYHCKYLPLPTTLWSHLSSWSLSLPFTPTYHF